VRNELPADTGGWTELPGRRGRVDHRSLRAVALTRAPPTQASHELRGDEGDPPVTAPPLPTTGPLPPGHQQRRGNVPPADRRKGPPARSLAHGLSETGTAAKGVPR
jgi:hypothetical protein